MQTMVIPDTTGVAHMPYTDLSLIFPDRPLPGARRQLGDGLTKAQIEARRAAYLDRLPGMLTQANADMKAEAASIIAQTRAARAARRTITRGTLVRIATRGEETRCATLGDCFGDDLDGLAAAIADLICRRLHCVGGGAAPLFVITLAE